MGRALLVRMRPVSTIPTLRPDLMGTRRLLVVAVRVLVTLNTRGTDGLATLVLRTLMSPLVWPSL